MIRNAKANYLFKIFQTQNSSQKFITKFNGSILNLLVENKVVSDDLDKANALNKFFSECFNYSTPPLTDNVHSVGSMNNILCSPENVCDIIKWVEFEDISWC